MNLQKSKTDIRQFFSTSQNWKSLALFVVTLLLLEAISGIHYLYTHNLLDDELERLAISHLDYKAQTLHHTMNTAEQRMEDYLWDIQRNLHDPDSISAVTRRLLPDSGIVEGVCLAFVPENSRELTDTRFEAYLINDSNYYVCATFANNEGAAWHLRWQGIIEPNTKQFVETFDRSALNDLERLSVKLIAWKQDKPFSLKPAVGVELRLDTVKFYKLHVFQPSPFFREPALVYDIVRDDRPIKQVFVEAEEVLDAMRGVEREPQAAQDEQPQVQLQEAPQRTRNEEREALKAAKRALKEEAKAQREKEREKAREKEHEKEREASDILEMLPEILP